MHNSISIEDFQKAALIDEAVLKNELEILSSISAQTFKITEPVVLSVYKPDEAIDKHIGVLICPGGGYLLHFLLDVIHLSKFLIKHGFTPIIFEYRLPNGDKNIPLDDLKMAFSSIKANADKWTINPEKIGILGTSAGGHLAAMGSSPRFAKDISMTPLFTVLCYPVITMTDLTFSAKALLGNTPTEQDILDFSAELQVTSDTPPTLILTGNADEVVSPMHSLLYGEALQKKDVDSALYIFPEGKHGFFLYENFSHNDLALSLLEKWLKRFI